LPATEMVTQVGLLSGEVLLVSVTWK